MRPLDIFRVMRANARLGWAMEGNWAPPVVYLLVALAAPAAGVLMLVFMYLVIMGVSGETRFLSFLITGSAVFFFVRLILQGSGMSVVEDREHYRVLRYIYIAPAPFPAQIAGRVASKIAIAAFGATATILAGHYILGLPLRPGGVNLPAVFGAGLLGVAGMFAFGQVLASTMLLVDRMGWVWAEGMSGLLFLLTGMVIPLDILPAPLTFVGKLLPMTYWAELWRHGIFGPEAALSLPGVAPQRLRIALTVSSITWALFAALWHRGADYLARRHGRIERETFY